MDPSGAVIGTSIISPLCQGCGIEQTLSTFADEAKPRGVVAKEGQDANQRDLGRLERQTWLNLIKSNEAESKVWHLGGGSPQYQNKPRDSVIGSSPEEIRSAD